MEELAFEEINQDKIIEGDVIVSFQKNHEGFFNKFKGMLKTWRWDNDKIYGVYTNSGVIVFRENNILIYPFSYFPKNGKVKIAFRRNDQIFYRGGWTNCYDRPSVKKYAEHFSQNKILYYNSKTIFTPDNFCKLCLMGDYYDERLEIQNNYPFYSFLSHRIY